MGQPFPRQAQEPRGKEPRTKQKKKVFHRQTFFFNSMLIILSNNMLNIFFFFFFVNLQIPLQVKLPEKQWDHLLIWKEKPINTLSGYHKNLET